MTATYSQPKTDAPKSEGDDKPIMHMFCATCFPMPQIGNVAICGYRARGLGPVFFGGMLPPDWPECVVCADLVPNGCPKCGAGR
jgi:hypothetical protein